MPKGVEHPEAADCFLSSPNVIYPLMPKGVEHEKPIDDFEAAVIEVIYPLMPKGVEHMRASHAKGSILKVIYPLMPKGVEHGSCAAFSLTNSAGDLSVDAERR